MEREEIVRITGERWVPGEGPDRAKIIIVGMAPGMEESRFGRPFIGPSGALLDGALRQAGISREEVYLTNVAKVRPPNDDVGRLKVPLQEFYPILFKEINSRSPNVIVALGDVALGAIANMKGVMKWRGSIIRAREELYKRKTVVALHPSYILRQYQERPLLVLDLKRAKQESSSPALDIPSREISFQPTFEEVVDFLSSITKDSTVAFDIETDGKGVISSMGLSKEPSSAISIPFARGWENYWTEDEEVAIWLMLRDTFQKAWEGTRFAAHNALFDVKRILPKVGYFPLYMDTMWAHQTVYPEMRKGLDLCASIYTKEPYYKDERKVWKDAPMWQQRGIYNGKDASVTREIVTRLEEELKSSGLEDFFFGHVMSMFPVLLWMETRGIRCDESKRKEILDDLERARKEIESRLRDKNIFGSKRLSAKRVASLLYEEMKMPVQYNRKTGRPTAGRQALQSLYSKTGSGVLKDILEYRRVTTLIDNFGGSVGERAYTSFSFVETGRLSSHSDDLESGTHLQNVPKSMRSMFIADEGMLMIEVDKKQAEAMVVAWMAGDTKMMEVFRSGGDVHKKNASIIFGKDESLITPEERSLAKKMVHANNYCQGPNTMAAYCGISVREAKEVREKYLKTFPRVEMWQKSVAREVAKGRVLWNPLGRRRVFFGRISRNHSTGEIETNDTVREAIAFLPQSTVVDDLNRSMVDVFYLMEPGRFEILHQIHDAVLMQARKEDTEEIIRTVKPMFEREIVINGERLVIPVDVKVGSNWEMKD